MKLLTIVVVVLLLLLLCLFIGCCGMYLDNTVIEGASTCNNDNSGSYKSKIISMNYKINKLNQWLNQLNKPMI